MKNNRAEENQTAEKLYFGGSALSTESVTATVWTPDYVARLRQNIHCCSCPGCDSASPLLQYRWKNHVRHSADISCHRAAAEILCVTASCTIALSEDAAEHLPELNAESLRMNQNCLRLFAAFQCQPALLLYVLGCFIRKAALLEPQQRVTLLESWLQPAARQRLLLDFLLQHGEEAYPPLTTQSLRKLPLWSLTASDTRLRKLEAMLRVDEKKRRQKWQRLLKTSGLRGKERQKMLSNYLFYELCHNLFPGHAADEWEKNFLRLCERLLNLNMLLIAVPPEAGKESVSALLAASQRAAREEAFSG